MTYPLCHQLMTKTTIMNKLTVVLFAFIASLTLHCLFSLKAIYPEPLLPKSAFILVDIGLLFIAARMTSTKPLTMVVKHRYVSIIFSYSMLSLTLLVINKIALQSELHTSSKLFTAGVLVLLLLSIHNMYKQFKTKGSEQSNY